jgi:hypothetical protein
VSGTNIEQQRRRAEAEAFGDSVGSVGCRVIVAPLSRHHR